MKTLAALGAAVALLGAFAAAADPAANGDRYWPQWRGPQATGVSPTGDPPVQWNETENVRWKVAVPGTGHASPIVWGDRIFLLTAIGEDQGPEPAAEGERRWPPTVTARGPMRFVVLALARADGRVLWQKTATVEEPHEGIHSEGSWAPCSPVTDGESLIAFFGSRGLFCYDLDGTLRWQKDLGDMTTRRAFGEGSSPALWGDVVVVNWDHEGDSFIVALDKRSGEERWRVARDEATSWSTPLIVEVAGKPQAIVAATGLTRSYDLATGKVVWQAGGLTVNVIPTPVYGNGLVYLTSGFRGNALQAIRVAAARGDVTGSEAIVWSHDQHTPYVPSPVLYGDKLYFVKTNSEILSCLDALTGKVHYADQRLPDLKGVFSSLVGAAGRIYVVGRNGTTVVIRHGAELEVLARNTLDDDFVASPAIVDRELYLRGRQHLYCLAPATSGDAQGPR